MRNNENSSCAVRHQGETVFREVNQPFLDCTAPAAPGRAPLMCGLCEKELPCGGDGDPVHEQLPRDGRRLFLRGSDLAVAQVTVNYLHGFGWLTQMCRDVSFTGVHFHPDPQHHVSSLRTVSMRAAARARLP